MRKVKRDICDPSETEYVTLCWPLDPVYILLQPHLAEVGERASRAAEVANLGHTVALAKPLAKVYLGQIAPRYDLPMFETNNGLLGTMVDCLVLGPELISQARRVCSASLAAERFEADCHRLTFRVPGSTRAGTCSDSSMVGSRGKPPALKVRRVTSTKHLNI